MGLIEDVLATKELKDLQVTKVTKSTTPTLTESNINLAIGLLKDIEHNNGYVNIAHKVGLTVEQIKEIHNAMKTRISELSPKEEEL